MPGGHHPVCHEMPRLAAAKMAIEADRRPGYWPFQRNHALGDI
jgi:hypothetical protein